MNTKPAAIFGYEDDNETPAKAAVAIADAHLSNAGLPTYSELLAALRALNTEGDRYLAAHRLHMPPKELAEALLARAGGAA